MKINTFYTLLLTIVVVFSCATEEIKTIEQTLTPEHVQKSDKYQITQSILSTVKEIADKEQETYLFTIAFNQNDYWLDTMSIMKKESIEPSLLIKLQGQYQVDCWVNGELLWSWSYDDKLTASQAILDCTDEYGGCSEICSIDARYFPIIKK
jgi:predicted metalloprotease